MGLVEYDSDSNSESVDAKTPEHAAPTNPSLVPVTSKVNDQQKPASSLFAALPAPKGRVARKRIILEAPHALNDIEADKSSLSDPDQSKIKRPAGTGLSALLPAPKRRSTLNKIASGGARLTEDAEAAIGDRNSKDNGESVMLKRDDEVHISGSNTAFRPKHIKTAHASTRSAVVQSQVAGSGRNNKTTATKVPRQSLFSITTAQSSSTKPSDSGSTETDYVPLLASTARPRPQAPDSAKASTPSSIPEETQVLVHASDAYRYDPSIDYAASHQSHEAQEKEESSSQDHTYYDDFAQGKHKKRRRERGFGAESIPPQTEMREINAAHEYAANQALIDSGEAAAQAGSGPIRFVGGGKHQLSSLLNLAHSQQDALEATFAQQKRAMRDSKAKYGR